jgi:hypothetical protein
MRRRLLFPLLASAAVPALLRAQETSPRPTHKIFAAQLHKALSARFPRWGVRNLLELQVDAPRLLLLPARQQLGATLVVEASGPQLREMESGEVDLVFSLRYEPTDNTLRAHQLDVLDLRWSRMPERTARIVQRLVRESMRDAVGEIVLHKFTAKELGLADTMGLQPEKIVVLDDGLRVEFGVKGRP